MRIKLKLIPILFLLIVNCAYVTISRTDYIYESKTIKNTELNNRFSLEFDLRHSTAEEIYFAKDTIPDSIYRLDFPDRQEYYKRVKYRNVSRGIACGHNTINRLEVNDTSKIRLIGIKLENAKFGKYGFDFISRDTGSVPLLIYAINDTLQPSLRIRKDTIYLDTITKKRFQRKKTSYLLILLGRLFWHPFPSFY
jgi:hypothetical protein